MKAASFEYIEVFYAPKEVPLEDNRSRQHSTLGYQSPMQYLDRWMNEQHPEKMAS